MLLDSREERVEVRKTRLPEEGLSTGLCGKDDETLGRARGPIQISPALTRIPGSLCVSFLTPLSQLFPSLVSVGAATYLTELSEE